MTWNDPRFWCSTLLIFHNTVIPVEKINLRFQATLAAEMQEMPLNHAELDAYKPVHMHIGTVHTCARLCSVLN